MFFLCAARFLKSSLRGVKKVRQSNLETLAAIEACPESSYIGSSLHIRSGSDAQKGERRSPLQLRVKLISNNFCLAH